MNYNFESDKIANLARYLEESTIQNQSLQLKSAELTLEMSKRKDEIHSLQKDLQLMKK